MLVASEQAIFAMAFLAVSNLASVRGESLFFPPVDRLLCHIFNQPV